MNIESTSHVSRRSLLQIGVGLALAIALRSSPGRAALLNDHHIVAAPTRARLAGADHPETDAGQRDAGDRRPFREELADAGPAVAGPPQNFVLRAAPVPVPALRFTDGKGRLSTLADFRGRIVLLNVWATWCLPCRKEMPTLDRLQTALGGPDFEVLTLSINRNGLETVKKFYVDNGIQHLAIYIDTSGKANFELATAGLPTTLLIDRQGQELGRLVGPAEWDAPDMVAFLRSIIVQKPGRSAVPQQKEQPP